MRANVDSIKLKNVATGASLRVNCDSGSHFIPDEIDWGNVEGKHHTYSYVGQIGTYITGTTVGSRDISIEGWVAAWNTSELSAYKRQLNTFFNPLEEVKLYYKQYVITFKPEGSVMYSTEYDENNEVFCKWKVEGVAADPLWGDADESIVTGATVIGGTFRFPLVIGTQDQLGIPPEQGRKIVMGYYAPSLTVTLYNRGAIAAGMRIVFYARGTVVNPMLLDVATQQYMKINKTLSGGETVTVNTSDGQKSVIGLLYGETEPENYYRYKDPDSTWLKVRPGKNFYRFTADSGEEDLEVYLYFYNRYFEVQVANE